MTKGHNNDIPFDFEIISRLLDSDRFDLEIKMIQEHLT